MSSPAGEPDLSACPQDTPLLRYPADAVAAAATAVAYGRQIDGAIKLRRELIEQRDEAILRVLHAGVGVTDTSRLCGVSLSTVKQIRLRKGK